MAEMSILELVKDERRRYARKWRAANKDKVQAANQRYWEKKARKRAEREKEADHEQR